MLSLPGIAAVTYSTYIALAFDACSIYLFFALRFSLIHVHPRFGQDEEVEIRHRRDVRAAYRKVTLQPGLSHGGRGVTVAMRRQSLVLPRGAIGKETKPAFAHWETQVRLAPDAGVPRSLHTQRFPHWIEHDGEVQADRASPADRPGSTVLGTWRGP